MDSSNSRIDPWLDRVRRMAEYRTEAADFIRRAGSLLPAADDDVELVCRLWTIADEYDAYICEALQKFDEAVFETMGELEITRGAEPVTAPEGNVTLSYICTWTLVRPDSQSAGVVLTADQVTGELMFEVRGSLAAGRPIGFPIGEDERLYKALTSSFFAMYSRAAQS